MDRLHFCRSVRISLDFFFSKVSAKKKDSFFMLKIAPRTPTSVLENSAGWLPKSRAKLIVFHMYSIKIPNLVPRN